MAGLGRASFMHPECPCEAAPRAAAAERSRVRTRGLAVAVACWAVLAEAAMLTPNPRGYGTHRQWGFPQCSFLARTGLPCPTCGLTTSVSATLHGRFGLALRAQPFGVVLALAVALVALAATAEFVTARPWLHRLRGGLWWLWAGVLGVLGGWGIVLAVGFARGTLPLH